MPSTTFAANTAGIYWSPVDGWVDTEESGTGNILVRHARLGGCQIDFVATGTDCTMKWATAATSGPVYQVSVDGGAFTTLTLPASTNTFTDVSLFTALADTAHTVTVKHSSGNGHPEYIWVHYASAFTVTGAAPAISAPTGFGNQYLIENDITGNGAVEAGWRTDGSAVFAGDLTGNGYNYSSPSVVKSGFSDSLIRFKTTSGVTSIKLWMYQNGPKLKLWKDGAASGSQVTVPNTSTMGWATLASGLDGLAHEYGIINTQQSTPFAYVYAVMLVGGSLDTTVTTWGQRRGAIVWVGDSILQGFGTSDSTVALAFQVCAQKNRECVNVSINGSTLISTYQTNSQGGIPRLADAGGFVRAAEVDYVVHNLGHNDGNAATGLAPSATDWQTIVQNTLTRTRALFPNATIYWFGYYPTSASTASTNRTALNNAASAAVTAMADAKIIYHSTDGVINPATDTTDGTHPNAGGYTKMVADALGLFTTWAPSSGGGIIRVGMNGGIGG